MRRREFITIFGGGAAVWPLTARAQQQATPVIGLLRPTGAADAGHLVAAVRQGLRESGYPSDKVAIKSRWADGRPVRLPKLAAELVALQVTAIVGSVEAALAAKGSNDKYSDRFCDRGRSGSGRACFQYQSTGRQYHRGEFF